MRGCSLLTRARSLLRKIHLPRRDCQALPVYCLSATSKPSALPCAACRRARAPRRGPAPAQRDADHGDPVVSLAGSTSTRRSSKVTRGGSPGGRGDRDERDPARARAPPAAQRPAGRWRPRRRGSREQLKRGRRAPAARRHAAAFTGTHVPHFLAVTRALRVPRASRASICSPGATAGGVAEHAAVARRVTMAKPRSGWPADSPRAARAARAPGAARRRARCVRPPRVLQARAAAAACVRAVLAHRVAGERRASRARTSARRTSRVMHAGAHRAARRCASSSRRCICWLQAHARVRELQPPLGGLQARGRRRAARGACPR